MKELPHLETGKNAGGTASGEAMSSCFGHVKFEMPSRYPNENVY